MCIDALGRDSAITRAIQRERRKTFPPEPRTVNELSLEGEWRSACGGDEWLVGDVKVNDDRVLIFATQSNLRILDVF